MSVLNFLTTYFIEWARQIIQSNCGPDVIRTRNSLNANQVLYQLELQAHC